MGRKSLKGIRQKEIVNAFYNVSKKEGLENASISKVAKEMDINPSLVLHYFNTKEDLVFGLIHFILERYKSIYHYESNEDVRARLVNTINNIFSRKWNTYVDDGVFYSCFALIFRSEKIKAEFVKMIDNLRSEFTVIIQEALDHHVISIDVTAEEASDFIFTMVEGSYYYLSLFNDDELSSRKLETYRKNTFHLLKLEMTNL